MENTSIKKILERIRDIELELMSMSYSQSNPAAMMDRRMMRKEKEKLEAQLANLTAKKKD